MRIASAWNGSAHELSEPSLVEGEKAEYRGFTHGVRLQPGARDC
jgi:hypothetical protein